MVRIKPDPYLRERDPLTGWRAFLRRWLGIPFRQGIVVLATRDGVWSTHPRNVQRLVEICKANNQPCQVIAPTAQQHLRTVPRDWGMQ